MSREPRARVALRTARAQLAEVCEEHGRDAMPVRHVASCVRWTPAR